MSRHAERLVTLAAERIADRYGNGLTLLSTEVRRALVAADLLDTLAGQDETIPAERRAALLVEVHAALVAAWTKPTAPVPHVDVNPRKHPEPDSEIVKLHDWQDTPDGRVVCQECGRDRLTMLASEASDPCPGDPHDGLSPWAVQVFDLLPLAPGRTISAEEIANATANSLPLVRDILAVLRNKGLAAPVGDFWARTR